MAEVKLLNITKIYEGKNRAVNDVSFEIGDKEFVVLVGPSGCGKSTTLRMIAGLEEISEGELFIDGKLVNNIPPAQRDIAMVFQNYALYPHMTVFENMAFGLKLRKYSKAEIKERVDDAAKILSIKDLLDRKPKQLSGGQRQRVAVGRAIVRKPKVFLFDEPLSNLDAKLRVQMRTEISKLHHQLGATMIYVTHDQTEAMTMGDRIVVMKDGYVQQIDTPMNLYNNPTNKFVASFIGTPAMNFIEGNINDGYEFRSLKGGLRILPGENQKAKLSAVAGKNIFLGIRPENISLIATGFSQKLSVPVELIEPMGSDANIYFNIDGTQFVCKTGSTKLPRAAEQIDVYLDCGKLHFFDKENEKII
ncbi:MAG: sn-glycerol-3-phosphate ABC transporter ATP-binding protein UgpC [Ignavibacteriales bacterium]|nr:sn-glycerol-3-phosphate ABC transporter ATP-binding protein UgpC [Ignavibacteriales bacterium]